MAELITILFALVGADDELQVVSIQEVLCDIGAPVAASTSQLIGDAAVLGHGVAPQQVQDLVSQKENSFQLDMADFGTEMITKLTFSWHEFSLCVPG